MRGWPTCWERLAHAYHVTGDHAHELRTVDRARRSVGAEQLWTAELEARGLAALGRTTDLDACLDRAVAMPVEAERTPGAVLATAAAELQAHGHGREAEAVAERAPAWFAAHPPAPGARAPDLVPRARTLLLAGRPGAALVLLRAFRARSADVAYQGLLGVALAREGDRPAAAAVAARLGREPRPHRDAERLYRRAAVLGSLGDRAGAVGALPDAYARGLGYGAWQHVAPEWGALAGYPPYASLVRPRP